jgi:hypothetical protein
MMTSGTPKVAHKIINTLRFTLDTSVLKVLLSNFRKEQKVKMKIATASQGLAALDRAGTARPMTTPAMTMAAPCCPASRSSCLIPGALI